jgi:hypothetical protein
VQHGNLVAVGIVSVQAMAKEADAVHTVSTEFRMPYLTNMEDIKKGAEATTTRDHGPFAFSAVCNNSLLYLAIAQ